MTYNAMIQGGYSRDHFTNSEKNEYYNDIWFNGVHYDNVTAREIISETSRKNTAYSGINARYQKGKFRMTHGIAFQWTETPGCGSDGSLIYNPDILTGNRVHSNSDSRSLSPSIMGEYFYKINNTWSFNATWNAGHSHNNSYSGYQILGAEPILNNVKENAWYGNFNITPVYIISNSMYFRFFLKETFNYFNMNYSGSAQSIQRQRISSTNAQLEYVYFPIKTLSLQIAPELSIYSRNLNSDFRKTDVVPGVRGGVYYTINNRSNASLRLFYAQTSPGASRFNDLILRQTELRWLEGNPNLKIKQFYSLDLSYYLTPVNWMSRPEKS